MPGLAKLLEGFIRLKGMSQAELASASGMHRANLCRFLAGTTDIRLSSLMDLLDVLHVDLEALLTAELQRRTEDVHLQGKGPQTLGGAFETLIKNSDGITVKTLLNTLVARSKQTPKTEEVTRALELIGTYSPTAQQSGGNA